MTRTQSAGSEKQEVWLADIIRGLEQRQFYGKLTIQFERGKITTVRQEETLKPPDQ